MEDVSEEITDVVDEKTMQDIPEEVLEYIFLNLSPYRDLKAVMLVCSSWHRLAKGAIRKLYQGFRTSVYEANMTWSCVRPDVGAMVTERYSHCVCYFNKSLYIFGGCTSTNTTLNDLWRFDLATREWIRPLAMGTYPFPKACASMVVYKENLVLFGGWSHPTPFPLHQAARFFSELHIYTPGINRWSHITTLSHQSPPPTAGHSASVIGDKMVVFGGSQVPGVRTNDLWVFDFNARAWSVPRTSIVKPLPRYGQSQITLDDRHILFLGGCGGPNQVFNDAWLLTIAGDLWTFEEIPVNNMEYACPQSWCHSACKVGNAVVVLSKPAKPPNTPPSSPRLSKVKSKRVWVPPREEQQQQQQQQQQNSDSAANENSPHSQADDHLSEMDQSGACSESHDLEPDQSEDRDLNLKTKNPRPGLPSVRPNAMKNRQRQLEALLKYEKKLRQSGTTGASNHAQPGTSTESQHPTNSRSSRNMAAIMQLHVLDIAHVLERKEVTWRPLRFDLSAGAPEEIIFYSLVAGRGELLMFGGIERDIQSIQRGHGIKFHMVNNLLYVLKPVAEAL